MAYIGKTPSQATRSRFYYTATGGETSLSGADDNGNTLVFSDGNFVDVMLNGVNLVAGTDYNTTTANTIGGLTALTADDVVEIVVYDTFSVFGGDVKGDFTITNGQLSVTDITANDSNGIQFNTDEGTERARLDDSGNLLVGKTSAVGVSTAGIEARNDGVLIATKAGGTVQYLNRTGGDGTIVDFRKDGTTVGSIRAEDGDIVVGNDTSGLKFRDTDFIPRDMDDTTSDNVVTLGSSGSRFKDLYLSGGVYLGGTGSANYLDDYETGTFTPSLRDASSGGNTISITAHPNLFGRYVKIGSIVHIVYSVDVRNGFNMNGAVAGNDLFLHGLPFPTSSSEVIDGPFSWKSRNIAGMPSGFNIPSSVFVGGDTSYLRLGRINTAGTSWDSCNVEDIISASTNNCQFAFGFTYKTDS